MTEERDPTRAKSLAERWAEEPPPGMDNNGNLNIVGFDPTYAERAVDPSVENRPKSLLDSVDTNVMAMLGLEGLDHKHALCSLGPIDGERLVETIHRTVAENYLRSGATANKNRSTQNWRWQKLNTYISEKSGSKEVIVERAVANACKRLNRQDWANQVPVSSGLVEGSPDKTRAIDLVHKLKEGHFEFIELKIESNKPLFAAVEIIKYGCIWLVARGDKPSRRPALLNADHVDLRVLAPAAYYSHFPVDDLERALDLGVRTLGQREGVNLSFAFKRLDERIKFDTIPDDETLLDCLDYSLAASG